MKIIIILSCLIASLSADVKVLNETKIKLNNFSSYIIQTLCKDGYQYTVVISGVGLGVTQDLKSSSTSTLPRVIECKNEK